jgi:hypothetical protein
MTPNNASGTATSASSSSTAKSAATAMLSDRELFQTLSVIETLLISLFIYLIWASMASLVVLLFVCIRFFFLPSSNKGIFCLTKDGMTWRTCNEVDKKGAFCWCWCWKTLQAETRLSVVSLFLQANLVKFRKTRLTDSRMWIYALG